MNQKATIWTDYAYDWKFLYINDERIENRHAIVNRKIGDKEWHVVTTFSDRESMQDVMDDFLKGAKLVTKK